jgi:hypothetical protein
MYCFNYCVSKFEGLFLKPPVGKLTIIFQACQAFDKRIEWDVLYCIKSLECIDSSARIFIATPWSCWWVAPTAILDDSVLPNYLLKGRKSKEAWQVVLEVGAAPVVAGVAMWWSCGGCGCVSCGHHWICACGSCTLNAITSHRWMRHCMSPSHSNCIAKWHFFICQKNGIST